MNAQQACSIYEKNWITDFASVDNIYARINQVAQTGGYEIFVKFSGKNDYDNIFVLLENQDYNVEHYTDGSDGIMKINWA